MQLSLKALFGRSTDSDDEDVTVAYDPSEDLVDGRPSPATKSRGRGRHPDVPKLTSPMKWALSRVANHVTFSDKRMVAWSGGQDDLVFPSTRGTPRSPARFGTSSSSLNAGQGWT